MKKHNKILVLLIVVLGVLSFSFVSCFKDKKNAPPEMPRDYAKVMILKENL